MPLYWRYKDRPGTAPGEPPAMAPFNFDYDDQLGLFIEQRSTRLTALLADIYSRNANVGYLQDGHSLIGGYGEDFWRFLQEVVRERPARSVLEVGCGGCVLLERFKARGHEVVGVDPSPVAAEAGSRKGIRVIQEFFPPRGFDLRQDLIFQMDVLEHIEDPLAFLRLQSQCLSDGGTIVVNVPNCARSIERGDISMALHQHVNMFDPASLAQTVRAAGLEVLRLEPSRFGAALYCAARRAGPGARVEPEGGQERRQRFEDLARRNIARFGDVVQTARKSGESIGFFMPQRAFPYLGVFGWFDGFRAFDNMNTWHRRYLDGLEVPIENQADLVAHPVEHLFVMSLTFGREVGDALRRDVPGMKITTLDDILV